MAAELYRYITHDLFLCVLDDTSHEYCMLMEIDKVIRTISSLVGSRQSPK